jgi:hypothetical protein
MLIVKQELLVGDLCRLKLNESEAQVFILPCSSMVCVTFSHIRAELKATYQTQASPAILPRRCATLLLECEIRKRQGSLLGAGTFSRGYLRTKFSKMIRYSSVASEVYKQASPF